MHNLDMQVKLSPNFRRGEFACKCGCGFATPDAELLGVLEEIRGYFNEPVTINSACRCESYNSNVGGSTNSAHLMGIAADIVVGDTKPEKVGEWLRDYYPDRYGRKAYDAFTHVDVRKNFAHW